MIYHSKGHDLEITDVEYHDDPTYTGEILPSQTSGMLYMDITSLCETELKKAKLEELSNNISERRCQLKANETASEQSERASGYIVGYKSKLSASEIQSCIRNLLYFSFEMPDTSLRFCKTSMYEND